MLLATAAAAATAVAAGVRLRARQRRSSGPEPQVLVTGGTGFIGSHIAAELLEAGYRVAIVDNLCNSSRVAVDRIAEVSGKGSKLRFYQADIRDRAALDSVFARAGAVQAVVHCAGLKAVGDSVREPFSYFENNVCGTVTLLQAMEAAGCTNIVFSSSATVYGEAESPITEEADCGPHRITNPYGMTKWQIEDILRAACAAPDSDWRVVLLRYFNPVGAHPSSRLGESPDVPNNLMPYMQLVCVGRRPQLNIFGCDYPTPDGTCVRDYVHVMDLAAGHRAAVRWTESAAPGCEVFNLGRGRGASVLELMRAMEKACGKPMKHEFAPRRPGDVAEMFAGAGKAERLLGWKATRDIDDMCRDAWNFQAANPGGL